MKLTKSRTAKFVATIAGFALAMAFVVTPVSAATIAELQAQIAALSAQLAALSGTPATTTGSYTFNTNLTLGSRGTDVMNLQKVLNSSADTKVASTGAGSPGLETSTFGQLTKAAVVKFQQKYGITPAAGYVGAITRAKLNSLGGVVVVPPPGGNPAGGSIVVSAGSQPANTLAPQSAARVPFTTFTIQTGSSDVTINSVTVERVGLAQDAVFAGVVLLKSDGTQIGIAKTLNSNHQALVGEPYVIKAGTTETFTVAGNMAASLSSYAGQVAGLNVVAINTTATVTGSLPISGAQQTVNASLTVGSVTTAASSYDPGTSQSKEIGTTGYKFSGIRVTAGSAEAVRLFSIRWNQTGSASAQDLANVVVNVDGTVYPTTVSADGKYYSANFGSGILIDKGLAKDIYIQGDIVGSGASGRTVKFDIYKQTDLYLKGETYGYGITPPTSGTTPATCSTTVACGVFTTGTPWFNANIVTVSGGSATSIGKATSVAAQNIAVNVPNQVLGGFQTDIKGEPISVQTLKFEIATSAVATGPLTNITIVDSNGAVVAGPVDEATTCTTGCTITFSDTVTFPVGVKTYTIKGKVPSGSTGTVVVSATPTTWSGVTGQVTGNTITLTNTVFSMNTMTIKPAALTVSVSSLPAAQSIVPGGQVTFTNFQFDASQSGEDVRFGALPIAYDQADNAKAGAPSKMTSCQLFDGATALNTGSNVLNPTETATTTSPLAKTITLDTQLTIPKGTVKTLTLKCNVAASADSSSTFQWGLTNGVAMTVTGVTSGADVSESLTTANGSLMTIATGSFTASVDTISTPNYATVAGGATGVNQSVFKFRASNEDVNLTKIGLVLTGTTPSDIGTVYLYQGSTLLGTATFTGVTTVATSTLNTPLLLAKDTDVLITVKADLAAIGTNQTGTEGQLVKVGITNAEGSGASSGTTLYSAGVSQTGINGVRMFRSFPTIALDTLSSTGLVDGKLMRFKITADSHGPVGIFRLSFTLATSTFASGGGVTAVGLKVYSDSAYSSPVATNAGSGIFDTAAKTPDASAPELLYSADTNPLEIPAGSTYYFELSGSISGSQAGATVATTLEGDAAYIAAANLGSYQVSSTTGADADTNDDFIWSGNATSTAVFTANDWANGYGIPGLPAGGLIQTRSN